MLWHACHAPEPFGAFQEAGGKAAIKAEPADGAAAETLAVDKDIKDVPEGAPPPDDKSEKEAEKAREKEKKKKFKVNEELLQAFRYFDRNCKNTWPFMIFLQSPDGSCCCCIGALVQCCSEDI